jgi:hypothetical protein
LLTIIAPAGNAFHIIGNVRAAVKSNPSARRCLGRFEQEIVATFGVERRIELDEVNGFDREVVAQDVKVVTKEKSIHSRKFYSVRTAAARKRGDFLRFIAGNSLTTD